MIPYTKTMDYEADLSRMTEEFLVVDSLFSSESPQDPHRRWEYCLALRVGAGMTGRTTHSKIALDVGGAGSPLVHMLTRAGYSTHVIDPKLNSSLGDAVQSGMVIGDYVTCVSVIEHVPDLMQFIWDLGQAVRQGGRLFLTTDIADIDDGAKDDKHFNWMRERLFTPRTWQMVAAEFGAQGFRFFGECDWRYHGDQVYDYSFASLALEKKGD